MIHETRAARPETNDRPIRVKCQTRGTGPPRSHQHPGEPVSVTAGPMKGVSPVILAN